jgi:hypothetical protein
MSALGAQVQGGVVEGLRTLLISPAPDASKGLAAKLRSIGAEMILTVSLLPARA